MPPIRPPLIPRPSLRVPIIVQCTSDVAETLRALPANRRLWQWHSNANANIYYFALPSKPKNDRQGYTFGRSPERADVQLGPNLQLSRLHFRVSSLEGEKVGYWTLFHKNVNHICVNGTMLPGQMRKFGESEESEQSEDPEPFEWKFTLATEHANHVQLFVGEEVHMGFYLHVYGDPRHYLTEHRPRERKEQVPRQLKRFAKRRWHHAGASIRKLIRPHGLQSSCSPKRKERLRRSIQKLGCALQASAAPVQGSEDEYRGFIQFFKRVERKVRFHHRVAFVRVKCRRARSAARRQKVKTKKTTLDLPIITIHTMVLTHRPKPG